MKNCQLLATALFVLAAAATPRPAEAQPAAAPTTTAPIPQLTPAQWREDLRFMVEEMEQRHANLYHSVSREDFQAAVADLHARIPSLQRNQIIVGMMRIAAMVGDGHTRVDPRKDARFGFRSLPLKLYLFEDGLYVRAATPGHEALVGARVEAIGGVPVEEALRRVAEIIARDNAMGPRLLAPHYLAMPDILHALDLSPRRDAATLSLNRDGRRWTATVPAADVAPLWPGHTDISLVTPEGWTDRRATPQPPLWLQAPFDDHRLIELPERDAIYVQLNAVTHIRGQTLRQFGERIAERAAATNPGAVILDLRLNQGGNGSLRSPFVRQLIKVEDEDTRLFVLTARGTFSASQFILDDLDRLTDAIFIGEPASSKPSSFGDAYRTSLPNSGISVRSSIYWWQEEQNRSPWTWVDVAAPLSFADYARGRDPALEAALNYQPPRTLRDQIVAAAETGGPAGVRRAIEAWRADPVNRYANQELRIVLSAEGLHGAGRREEALMAAELATEMFPSSYDAFNVFAHLAEAAGQKEVARRAGARVLEIDPNNRFARSLLERLATARAAAAK